MNWNARIKTQMAERKRRMLFKGGPYLFCAGLLLASPSICEAVSTDGARAGHRKAAKITRAQPAKEYGAGLNEQQSLRALESEISRKLGSSIQASDYPEEARRQGWSGTTLVGVVVAADGKIKQVSIGKTSGFPLLDEQALRMVARVRIWWIPQRLRKREVNVSVPVGFYIPRRLTTTTSGIPVISGRPRPQAPFEVLGSSFRSPISLPAVSARS